MRRVLASLTLVATPLLLSAQVDRYGTWMELAVEKQLPYNLEVEVQTSLRAQHETRWDIGAGLGYKPSKYFGMGLSYCFLDKQRPGKISKESYDEGGVLESYRKADDAWSPRHRVAFDLNPTVKLWKWLRLSLRERYQFTYRTPYDVSRTDYEFYEQNTPQGVISGWDETPFKDKHYDGEASHTLRSRLKLELDKKGCRFSPYISAELHNNMGESFLLEKVRAAAGLQFKVNKRNSIDVGYILTADIHDEDNHERVHSRLHALSVGYKYKF